MMICQDKKDRCKDRDKIRGISCNLDKKQKLVENKRRELNFGWVKLKVVQIACCLLPVENYNTFLTTLSSNFLIYLLYMLLFRFYLFRLNNVKV